MTHAVVLLLVAAAPVPAAKPLNGQWWPHKWQQRVAIFSTGGQPYGSQVFRNSGEKDGTSFHVAGGRLVLRRAGAVVGRGRLRPRDGAFGLIDLTDDDGDVRLGIYKLERGVLTICLADPDKPRPESFTDKEQQLVVLKRVRPPEKAPARR
jgi:uncharacterized protein (TIGR03067 family)